MLTDVLTMTQILQHLQAQATEVMEDLTKNMFQLGIMGQKEAIAMKIITVVTLVYLPATFVSVRIILSFLISHRPLTDLSQTFFSTDVVKYQNQNNDLSTVTNQTSSQSYSGLALERWIEVTFPLTFLTVVAAVYFYRKYVKHTEFKAGIIDSLPFYYKSCLGP